MYDLKQTNADECGAQTLDKSTGSFSFTGNIIVLKGCFPLGAGGCCASWGFPFQSSRRSSDADAHFRIFHVTLSHENSLQTGRVIERIL